MSQRFLTHPHRHRLVVLAPVLACLSFGFLMVQPSASQDSIMAFAVPLFVGVASVVGGSAAGIALAVSRRDARWLCVPLTCVLSALLFVIVGLHLFATVASR